MRPLPGHSERTERMRNRVVQRATGRAIVVAGGVLLAQTAAGQDALPVFSLGKIEVTGSHIARSEAESALPVQTITREEIERSGTTTTAELMSKVSANILGFNDRLSIGDQIEAFPRPGLSSVNLRGIGDGSTLVLIDGRRVANYAFDGGAVDVNSIPLSAIDRVEILKDGASAIYGTDAIAGVVNFILRKDFRGSELTGLGSITQHGGGDQYQATASVGHGDLAKDRFNAFVSASFTKDTVLRAADREFTRTGYRPGDGLLSVNLLSFPANIVAGRHTASPNFASGCAPPVSFALVFGGNAVCAYDPGSLADVLPPVERTTVFGRATLQLDSAHQLFAEAGYAHNRFALTLPATPVFSAFLAGGQPFRYPAGGPYYPSTFAAENGISGDLNLRYRTVALGNRVNDVDTRALRTLLGLEGAYAGWDYDTAILYSENRQRDHFASGYVSQQRLLDAFATGLINPFGPSGPEGDALLAGTQVAGDFHDARGSTLLADAKASGNLFRLPGGPLAIALGIEARREKLVNTFSALADSGDVVAAGGDHHPVSASRSVQALYVEASVPLAPAFESQLAARYDHYGDFGSTVNPKIALRWQPVTTLLLRASWGTGFRAPTLYDLFTPAQHGIGSPDLGDPLRCPVTGRAEDCGDLPFVVGGNPSLQPETSKQFNAGVVWEPVSGFAVTLDYWRIDKRNVIGTLGADIVLNDLPRWGATNLIRGPVDPDFPKLPGPIETIVLLNQNLGNLRTSGYDVDLRWRAPVTRIGRFTVSLNGTYIDTLKQQFDGTNYQSLAGNNDFGPVPRWRHHASLGWSRGPWTATLAQTFQIGYNECDERTRDAEGICTRTRRVGSYSPWDLQASYAGFKNTRIDLGIRNLFDRDPPFAQHSSGFAAGDDAQYADPRGRTFYAKFTFAFK